MLTAPERDIIIALSEEYMKYALLPVQKEKINLWKALNRSKMERPMVAIDQLPWHELVCPELTASVSDPYWVNVERNLRQKIYMWKNFPVDMVLDPFISIPEPYHMTGYGIRADVTFLGQEDSTAKSQHYANLISKIDDISEIRDFRISPAPEALRAVQAQANDLYGKNIPYRMTGHSFNLGIWDYITTWMSVESLLDAFYDDPELLHAVISRTTDSTIAAIEDVNACGAANDISNVCHCSYIYTDDLLPDSGLGKGRNTGNCWASGTAQLFTSISPAMFEEFEIPYISQMAGYFAYIYYGCCDKLDDRLDAVKRIPNVRKVSCSPWSDRENFAKKIGQELIMSVKPSPAQVATVNFDEGQIKGDLTLSCELARQNGVNIEFILKDVSTVRNDPARLTRWADIAMEVADRFGR